jgi:uncharacterized protein YdhG (YjbR/CyaY superfamily)
MKQADTSTAAYTTIDEYIALFPADIQQILAAIRATIRKAAPQAIEKIAYRMPTFHQKQNLVHFAVMKHHIGFYPGAEGVAAFTDDLVEYKTSKGAIQFPLSQPIPHHLISMITAFRVKQVCADSGTARKNGGKN